jgi:UDP-N-acetylglucosamine 4,6-dehydratase
MADFNNATILITGGTGSFGSAVLRRLLKSKVKEIRIFSRDEKKQDDMRKQFHSENLKFYLGDVRDKSCLIHATYGVDYIFHAAALKQVPSCEFYPMEAVKTNILGTENLIDSAIYNHVEKVVCLSTDKAVYPINAMGLSKAIMEKVLLAKTRHLDLSPTIGCCTRYGNVMASRNSVIPLFVDQIQSGNPITVTDPKMTRFMMSLEESVDLVLFALDKAGNGEILVQKAPAVTIEVLVSALKTIFNSPEHPVKIIGTRHGEKVFETLLSREEMAVAEEVGNYYRVRPDLRDLNYQKFVQDGTHSISKYEDYTSHNTVRLDEEKTREMLLGLPFIQQALKGNYSQPLE